MATVYLKPALASLRGLAQFICLLSTRLSCLAQSPGPVTIPALAASGWKSVKQCIPSPLPSLPLSPIVCPQGVREELQLQKGNLKAAVNAVYPSDG